MFYALKNTLIKDINMAVALLALKALDLLFMKIKLFLLISIPAIFVMSISVVMMKCKITWDPIC